MTRSVSNLLLFPPKSLSGVILDRIRDGLVKDILIFSTYGGHVLDDARAFIAVSFLVSPGQIIISGRDSRFATAAHMISIV